MELVDLEDELNSNEVSLTDIVNSKPSVIGEVYYTKWMTVYKHYPDGKIEVIDMVMIDEGGVLQPGNYVTFDIKKKDEC